LAIKALGAVVGGVGALLGAGLALFAPALTPRPRVDPQTIAADLDGRLRETVAGVHSRVATLAELPRLAAAVSTDAATVGDLTRDELAFRPRPGETITIGQVLRAPGSKPVVLIRQPRDADGEMPALDQIGARVVIAAGKLAIAEVLRVTPHDRAGELTGVVAVVWPVDVTTLAQRLDEAGAAVRIELPVGQVVLGRSALAPGGQDRPLPLTSELARSARVNATLALEPGATALRPVGAAVALLSLLIGAGLARGKRAPHGAPALHDTPPPPVGSSSPTQAATGSSSGTLALAQTAVHPSSPTRAATATSPAGAVAMAHTAVALDALSPGAQVGRYTIVRPLGSGGMANVFLARATGEAGFEKLVALKVLNKTFATQKVVVEHFLDEARLAAQLTHPNIVQIADLGKACGEYFIAMEYVDGADLDRLLVGSRARGELVPLRVGLAILRKICDGLHAAHTSARGDGKPLDLVHRDVKSANVFVAKNGVVKVGDFGIAKANVERRVVRTEIGTVKGTAAYMAPEHRIGEVIDRRADLYAVGAIAYEILTGREVNLDLAVLADKGRQGWPHLASPSQVRPELPAALDDIVFRCLAYDRNERYADCAVLEEALERVAAETNSIAGEKIVAQWVESALANLARAAAPGAVS